MSPPLPLHESGDSLERADGRESDELESLLRSPNRFEPDNRRVDRIMDRPSPRRLGPSEQGLIWMTLLLCLAIFWFGVYVLAAAELP